MSGKLVSIVILVCAVLAGALLYYLQVYYFYERLGPADVTLNATGEDGSVTALSTPDLTAIDADSSPIRFRACFTLPEPPPAALYEEAVPLNAPFHFRCFDAAEIGEDLEAGKATAWLSEANMVYGVDRVIARYPDGRAYAWQQINHCGTALYDGLPVPDGCPPAPGR